MKKVTSVALVLLFPVVTHAQTLQLFFGNLIVFLSTVVIPFLLGIAFLFFVINAIRFFVVGGANEQGREKAKALAIYGISAFVLIVVFWGIINMLSSSIGLDNKNQPQSDYVTGQSGSRATPNTSRAGSNCTPGGTCYDSASVPSPRRPSGSPCFQGSPCEQSP